MINSKKGYLLVCFLVGVAFFGSLAGKIMAANCGDTNSDGATEAVCACGDTVMGTSSYTYQLTDDLGSSTPCSANGLTIGSANITIDGNGHTITGSRAKNSYGIYNNALDNVTITNATVTAFYNGIYFSGSANSSTISNINATSNAYNGIYLAGTTPSGNIITSSTANSNYIGINLESASNTLTNNAMSGNIMANLYTDPLNSTIGTSNTVEGKSVYYLYGTAGNSYYSGQTYDGSTSTIGMFWCINCVNVTLQNATLAANNYYGVLLSNTTSSTIDHVTANYNYYGGIYVQSGSNGNTITNNTVKYNNNQGGIYFNNSSNNTVSGNTVKDNPGYGIYFTTSAANNVLTNNTISGNPKGNIRAVTTALVNSIDTSNTVEGKVVYYLYGTSSNSFYSGQTYDGSTSTIGMFWCINCVNVTLQNATLAENNYDSIYFNNTASSTINNVIITSSFKYGIHFDGSATNTISNSIIKSNFGYGAYLATSNSNTFTGNTFLNNINDIYNTGTTNTFTSNEFLNNITSKALTFIDPTRTKSIGNTASSTITMLTPNGGVCTNTSTPSCVATITTNPSETITITTSSNQVTASFVPSQSGVYSLNFTVTDSNGNTTKRRIAFLVGDTSSQTVKYYLRNTLPVHGQPSGSDLRAMSLTAPTSTENWNCGNWVQNSPEEIPNYPLSNLSSIDIGSWYRQFASTAGYIGAERYTSFANTVNSTGSIAYAGDYTWVTTTLSNLNWVMDYPQNWYWLALKLTGAANGTYPNWKTTAAQPSYADFTYQYATTPAVKSVSNDNIIIVSATASSTATSNVALSLDGSVDSALSGTGTASIVLDNYKRPFQGYTSTIGSDGSTTLAVTGITSTVDISSVPLDITPDAGSVAVSGITWNTGDSDNYSKQWTENGTGASSADHIVGNLRANYYYTVKVDGSTFGTYQADSSGQISFDYTQGYSTHTFVVSSSMPMTTATATADGRPYTFGSQTNYDVSVSLSCIDNAGAACSSTFYCTDTTNTCTPTTQYSGSISVTPAGGTRTLYIRYYSVDSSSNSEEVNSKSVGMTGAVAGVGGGMVNKSIINKATTTEAITAPSEEQTIKLLISMIAKLKEELNNLIAQKARNQATVPTLVLRPGMINNQVSLLQIKLKELGYFNHSITKYFGPVTRQAVIKFQKDNNITPASGIYGAKTRAVMQGLK